MPRFISDGKTPEDLQDFLEPGEHLLVDHSAIPGVLSPAAHGTTDHTGIPGVGDLTTAAHAVLNHAGIPGVGLQGTQVLSAPQTQASLQAALYDANTKVVFLLPGLYNLGVNGQIIIPQGKALIGLSGVPPRNGSYSTSYHAVFQLNTTLSTGNAYFRVNEFARLANIAINATGSSGSSSIFGIQADYGAIIENIIIERWMEGVAAPNHAVVLTGGTIARNVIVRQAKGKGFLVDGANPLDNVYMESCIAFACGNHGFELSDPCTLVNCYAYGCSGHGFSGHSPSSFQKLTNCVAQSNSSDGFNYTFSSTTDGTLILGCTAITNGGWGFNLTAGSGGRPGAVGCCARGNISGGFNFSGWQNFANWNAT